MHLPLSSRLLFTFTGLFVAVGANVADYSRSHLFNPKWPPHAKFHTGQTMAFSLVLGLLTIWFAWRETTDLHTTLFATASFASAYWVTQLLAGLYPNTAFFDPGTRAVYLLGLPVQAWCSAFVLTIVALACWLALRA